MYKKVGSKFIIEQDEGSFKIMFELVICQQQKQMAISPGWLLQPMEILDMVWEEISLNFITSFPKSKGYEANLFTVDHFQNMHTLYL